MRIGGFKRINGCIELLYAPVPEQAFEFRRRDDKMRIGNWKIEKGGIKHGMTKAHEEIIDFMAGGSTSADVASFKPSAKARKRVANLIAQEKTFGLLPEEKRELEEYMQLEHLMRRAKARARQLLSGE